jgi:hypothetical protein
MYYDDRGIHHFYNNKHKNYFGSSRCKVRELLIVPQAVQYLI